MSTTSYFELTHLGVMLATGADLEQLEPLRATDVRSRRSGLVDRMVRADLHRIPPGLPGLGPGPAQEQDQACREDHPGELPRRRRRRRQADGAGRTPRRRNSSARPGRSPASPNPRTRKRNPRLRPMHRRRPKIAIAPSRRSSPSRYLPRPPSLLLSRTCPGN